MPCSITVEEIETAPRARVREPMRDAITRTASPTQSYRASEPVDLTSLVPAA
jgi:hypothetical protein